jgi:hypothetical protein
MCIVLLSAGVVWNCVCVLILRIFIIVYGVDDMSLKMKQYSFVYFVCERNKYGFFKAVHMSAFLGYMYYFHCVLYVSAGMSRV